MYTQASDVRISGTVVREMHPIEANRKAGFTHVLAFALLVGTGGCATADYFAKRNDHGYKFININAAIPLTETAIHEDIVRTSTENLVRVREVLKPTITELARLFGVSRQAVYDWQAGKSMAPGNAAKLDDLAKAADAIALTGTESSSQLLRRKIVDGKSLLDVVREGGSATHAAKIVAQTLYREAKQRKQLALRLAGRAKPNVSHDEFGIPMLDERS